MAQITGTPMGVAAHAVHIPEVWSRETLDAVKARLVISQRVNRRWEKEMRMGDIFRIGYRSNLTASTKSAATDVTVEAVTESEETITIGTHQYVAFAVEEIARVQAKRDMRARYSSNISYVLGSAVDTNLAALAASFDNTVGVLGVETTYDNLVEANQFLQDANVGEGDRSLFISPATEAGLLKLDELKNADYVGPQGSAVRNANIGKRIMNADIFVTTLVHSPSSGQSNNWLLHREGAALIMQNTKIRSDFILLSDAHAVVGTQIYGFGEILIPPITAGGGTALDNHNVTVRGVG